MDPIQENDPAQAPPLDPILPPQRYDCWAFSSLRKLACWGSNLRAALPAYISARISVGNEVMQGVREAAAFASSSILTVFLPLIAIAAMVLILSSPSSSRNSVSILHQVPEGHVGVYWRGGALLKTITEPGFHLKLPLLTQYEPVQVVLHTDMVTDIPCGTKGGVMINFEKIEVVNRLQKEYVYETLLNYGVHYDKTWIYDKIHHEINMFCSSHSLHQVYVDVFDQIGEKMKDALQVDCSRYAPGIEIISVRVTKPTIPDSIRHNFEQMEEERAKVLIAMERQKVAQMEAETLKKVAISEAEKNANVCKILMERKLLEMEGSMRQLEIENQMFLEREKIVADAAFYRATKEAEANRLKLTPEFLKLKLIEAFGEEAKRSFGDKVFLAYPLLLVLSPCLLFFSRYFVAWCTTCVENNLHRGRQMLGSLAGIVRHFC